MRALAASAGGSFARHSWIGFRVRAQLATEFEAVSVSVMEEAELLEKGLNLLAAVGQGAHRATHKPRLVTIEYRGAPDRSDTQIAFVGKVCVCVCVCPCYAARGVVRPACDNRDECAGHHV